MASRARGIVLVSAMVFGGILFATPVYGENADYIVDVETSLGVEFTTNDVTLNLFPNNHMFEGKNLGVSVTTNNPTGYVLSMTSTGTNLINTADSTKTIPTLATLVSGYTEDTFTTNRWGYRVGTSGNYFAYTSGVTIADKRTLVDSDTTTVGFAGKIDYTQPTGTYTLPIVFAAVANHVPIGMQKTTTAKCPTTPTLALDVRDGEEYYIQKLADGKCWMLDNLRLNPYTVSLDDLKGNTNATDTSLTYLKNGGGSGRYAANRVGNGWTNAYNVPGFDASQKDVVPTPLGSIPTATYGTATNKIGVYYNFCAASAGSYCYPAGQGTGNATEDICPVNWRLPTTAETAALYSAYSSNHNAFKTALSMPLGGFKQSTGLIGSKGEYTFMHSSTIASVYNMYIARIQSTTVTPSDGSRGRIDGYVIRCILK